MNYVNEIIHNHFFISILTFVAQHYAAEWVLLSAVGTLFYVFIVLFFSIQVDMFNNSN